MAFDIGARITTNSRDTSHIAVIVSVDETHQVRVGFSNFRGAALENAGRFRRQRGFSKSTEVCR
jgi:hypothetical protein